jgi:extracellular matrix protein 14
MISKKNSYYLKPKPKSEKNVIQVNCGMNPAEWISSASCFYAISSLIEEQTCGTDWSFLPVVNPDGYEYTRTNDRLFTKNRQQTTNPFCSGVYIPSTFAQFFEAGKRHWC